MARIADVSAEAVLLAGGARAILLQLANPAVAAGVAGHSDFAGRPLERLHGTLTYLYVIVYGTPEEVARVARRVGAAHRPVNGDGYDARDTDAQVWVAATIYDTAMQVLSLVNGTDARADERLLNDYAVVGGALGVPSAVWPSTPHDFTEYWLRASDELSVGADALAVARELLHPRSGPWWMRAVMPAVRLFTAGLLTPELREAYDLPLDQKRFDRMLRVIRAVYPRLPSWVRHAPKRRYLRAFRRG